MMYSRKLHGHFTACGHTTRSGCIARLISTGARLVRSYVGTRLLLLLGIIVALILGGAEDGTIWFFCPVTKDFYQLEFVQQDPIE